MRMDGGWAAWSIRSAIIGRSAVPSPEPPGERHRCCARIHLVPAQAGDSGSRGADHASVEVLTWPACAADGLLRAGERVRRPDRSLAIDARRAVERHDVPGHSHQLYRVIGSEGDGD